jgi:hypothetical protein
MDEPDPDPSEVDADAHELLRWILGEARTGSEAGGDGGDSDARGTGADGTGDDAIA